MGVSRIGLGVLLLALGAPAWASAQCETDDLDGNGVPDVCPAGSNYIEGSPGGDFIFGTGGADCIFTFGGNDIILAFGGADYICSGDGGDTIFSGGGSDVVFSEGGNDFVVGGGGSDTINGGDGDDTLSGSGGDDTINGGEGNDTLNGNGGNDTLSGEGGNDDLNGGEGNDSLSGGSGENNLDGGGGTNVCVEEVPGTSERLDNCAAITFAAVSDVAVWAHARGLEVRWTTTTEVGVTAFRVWRTEPDGRLEYVGEIGASPEGSPHGADYALRDSQAPRERLVEYWIEERTVSGGSVRHGPFARLPREAPLPSVARSAAARVARKVPWSRLERPQGLDFGRKSAALGVPTGVEIVVDRPGLVEVSLDALAEALGVTVDLLAERAREGELSLRLRGESIAWHSIDDGRALRFVSHEVVTPFSATSRYLLTLDSGTTMTFEEVELAAASGPHVFRDTLRLEENVFPGPTGGPDPRQDLFFWHALGAGDEFSVPVSLPHAADAPTEVRVTIHGATHHPEQPHRVELFWNGVTLGTFETFGRERHTLTAQVGDAPSLDENELLVRQYAAGETPPFVYLDTVEVDYPRFAVADAPSLWFESASDGPSSLASLSSERVALYDVTSTRAPRFLGELDASVDGDVSFVGPGPGRSLLGVGADGWVAPVEVRAHRAADLRRPELESDYVIVAASHLVEEAQGLAAHREADGYRVSVVDVDDVYWAFAGGEPDPASIRAFLSFAWESWETRPRFVTLVGKGSSDYRDLLGAGGNWVPAMLEPTDGGLFPSDSVLGDVVGDDGIPEIAVGRLPVTTGEELTRIVEAIEDFERGHETRPALFAADDDEGGEFAAAAQAMAVRVPGDRARSIELGALGLEDAREQLLSAWAESPAWLTYVGHGGLDRLGTEGLLMSGDVEALSETDGAPFVAGWSCNLVRFDLAGFSSIGERLVTSGASAGVFSATGWSNHVETDALRTSFTQAAFASDVETVGDAILTGHRAASDASLDVHRVYLLLGDPALRLRQPKAASPEPPESGPAPALPEGDAPGTPGFASPESAPGGGCGVGSDGRGHGPSLPLLLLGAWVASRRRRRRRG